MMDELLVPLRIAATVLVGLMAGLFFAFSISVMKGLSRVPSAEGMAAMQQINVAILNPIFLPMFLGSMLLCLGVAATSLLRWSEAGAGWLVAGSVVYVVGAFLVTMVVNVPMNEALMAAKAGDPGSAALWAAYLSSWTAWNHVRTVSSIAGFVGLLLGAIAAR